MSKNNSTDGLYDSAIKLNDFYEGQNPSGDRVTGRLIAVGDKTCKLSRFGKTYEADLKTLKRVKLRYS